MNNTKLQMRYMPERTMETLLSGNIDGYKFEIISYGTHPCAYVAVDNKHPYFECDYEDLEQEVDAHGGITYSRHDFPSQNGEEICENQWVIGWDYAHMNDYLGSYEQILQSSLAGKKWTTDEILDEVKNVIEQLKGAVNE